MNKIFRITAAAFFSLLIFAPVLRAETEYAAQTEADEKSYAKWRAWIHSKQDYLGRIELLMKDGRDIAIIQSADLDEAVRKKDKVLGEKAIADTTKKLSVIVDELKALEPPPEFRDYHVRVVEAYTCRKTANEATLTRDVLNIRDYGRKATELEVEAMEIIRKLYISHDAPPQLIDYLDRGIAAYRQRLAGN